MNLSVIIPAYNEAKRLPATLDRVQAFFDQSQGRFGKVEIVVVNDGSKDATAELVRSWAARDARFRLLENPGNRGKGYAVRNGMLNSLGEWRLFSDADLSAPIEDIDKLLTECKRQNAVVAIGSRALDRSTVTVHQPFFREASGRFFNLFMRTLTGLPFMDTQCGFKLFRADAAKAIFERQLLDGFSFDVEDLVIAQALGLKSIEVPVRWADVEGTKVSLTNGLKSFGDVLTIRANRAAGKYR